MARHWLISSPALLGMGYPATQLSGTTRFGLNRYPEETETTDKRDYAQLARMLDTLEKVIAALVQAN